MRVSEFLIQSCYKPIGTGNQPYVSWKIESEKNHSLQQNQASEISSRPLCFVRSFQ